MLNKKEFDLSGITKWHELGYTGKNIKIANMESTDPNLWFFDGKIIDHFKIGKEYNKNYHGTQTADVLHQIAPDVDIYILPSGGQYGVDYAKGDFIEKAIPYMEENGICLVNASLGGTNNQILNNRILQAQECGVTFITSAGNEDDSGASPFAKSGIWIAVAAVHLDAKGNIVKASYSSIDEEVDFTQFSGIEIHDARKGYEWRTFPVYGTSFSSPMLCGMLALVQQFFLEKTGRTLTQDELYEFMKDYSIDLWELGRDVKSGYGLFLLPENPANIDVKKYIGGDIQVGGIKGIDVSEWQGFIDWQKVKASGVQFAMIRTSYGKQSLDKKYKDNISMAQAAGIDVGAYHYCYATSVEDAKAEARHFINTIRPYKLTYPAVLDLEDHSQANLDKKLLTDIAVAFMDIVKNAGYYPMLYASKYWLESKLDYNRLKDYDIWLAQWALKPTWNGDIGIWQYTDSGRINGINGNVDLDIAYKDYPNIINKKVDIVDNKEHWAQKYYDYLTKEKGIVIHETRFDDTLTRGEIFALLARIMGYKE